MHYKEERVRASICTRVTECVWTFRQFDRESRYYNSNSYKQFWRFHIFLFVASTSIGTRQRLLSSSQIHYYYDIRWYMHYMHYMPAMPNSVIRSADRVFWPGRKSFDMFRSTFANWESASLEIKWDLLGVCFLALYRWLHSLKDYPNLEVRSRSPDLVQLARNERKEPIGIGMNLTNGSKFPNGRARLHSGHEGMRPTKFSGSAFYGHSYLYEY